MATTDVALERTSLGRSAFGPPLRPRHAGAILAALGALVSTAFSAVPAAAQLEHSDAVRVWNLHAVDALVNAPTARFPGAGQTPRVSQLHLAIMHGAVYDAVNSIDGGYQPYLRGLPPASPSTSLEAAVATAAHQVLVGLELAPPLSQVVRDRLMLYTPKHSRVSLTARQSPTGSPPAQPPRGRC